MGVHLPPPATYFQLSPESLNRSLSLWCQIKANNNWNNTHPSIVTVEIKTYVSRVDEVGEGPITKTYWGWCIWVEIFANNYTNSNVLNLNSANIKIGRSSFVFFMKMFQVFNEDFRQFLVGFGKL